MIEHDFTDLTKIGEEGTALNMIELIEAKVDLQEAMIHGNVLQCIWADVRLDQLGRRTEKFVNKSASKRPWSWLKRNRVLPGPICMNIFLICMDRKRTLQVEGGQTFDQICTLYDIPMWDSWFSFNGKPLREGLTLAEQGVSENSTLVQHVRMLGGSEELYRAYTHVLECERQVLASVIPFVLQADEQLENEEDGDGLSQDYLKALMEAVTGLHSMLPTEHLWLGELLENFFQMAYWTRKCDTKSDYAACVMLSYKLLTGKSVGVSIWRAFQADDLQDDTFTKLTRDARDMFNMASTLINNPLAKKLKQIYTYLLVQGFLTKLGKNVDVEEFLVMERKVKPTHSNTSMVLLVVDTALQICERIDAYRLTGDWHALIHDDATYTGWVKDAERIINLAPFTSNLAAHGTTYFKFISDLNDAIERGEAVCRYSHKTSGLESATMRKRLNALQMLKNVEVTRRSSQKERKAPFGVLLHGGSSVAKSAFAKMLYYYYGKVHGLEVEDHYRYVRNPADEYWSNFDSSKWCIQLDDIAFLLPAKSSDVDPTLKELLNVVNNVPYVPPQAALEDKGKTPVMAKFVVATSNAADLNAQDYFQCPLAVRRRLPYVIHIQPKPEYLAANGKFIEPTKLPKVSGAFPDFWIITVQQLAPIEHNGRDSASLQTVKVFSSSSEFLKHFAAASVAHETNQEASEDCDVQMRDIKVCRLCYEVGDACVCLQSFVVSPFTRYMMVYAATWLTDFFSALTVILMATWAYVWLARFYVVRHVSARWVALLNQGAEIRFHSLVNGHREYKFKIAVKHLLQAGIFLTRCYLTYKAGQFVLNRTMTPEMERKQREDLSTAGEAASAAEHTHDTHDDDDKGKTTLQGNIHGSTEEQLEKEEARNVWYNPTIELSQFDVPTPSRSMATVSPPGIRDLFAANCVRIHVKALDTQFETRMGAVYLRGQYLLCNRHAIRLGTRFKMTIGTMGGAMGINGNIDCYFDRVEVQELPERDLIVLRVRNSPPRKDILKYWNTSSIPATHIVSVKRTAGGTAEYTEVFNVQLIRDFPVEVLNQHMDVYLGTSCEETKLGDCGSLGVALTPQGPIVIGVHTLGYKNTAGFPHVTRSELETLCLGLEESVEGGGAPELALNGEVVLGPIHHKSIVRYIPDGTANVYGTLPGFRPKPRTRVCATPLQDEMSAHFNCGVQFGPPVMTGWEPMYKNVVEMVRPFTDVDQRVLDHCVAAYAKDILDGLNERYGDAWKSELVTLSRRATVNGLPGVKFIDRINVNTSMGHPWNKTKKQFLVPAPDEKYPEGVDFVAEVWDRVDRIEALYREGKRAFPVFTGHLKDEAVSLAKIEAKKTRVFTGAPIDWSLVVRSRLLSFVRLLQKNKLIFEAAPGTVAQSVEWSHFYDYLTEHGTDRIIAGDYSKFDKHMIAAFVLGTYDVIGAVYKAAGFSSEEIRFIKAIGYDTAFPVCNMNGTIIEMFGTNPSGQPLTVVNNSMANSLYMRYAYCKLNPAGEACWDFKHNVNLLTYGDDNAMGVRNTASWFYHGAIQTALAQIGVGYTMADKDAETRPYISIEDCSFLKRKWRKEEELEMYTCPLEEASIHKSLTVWVPSKTVDKYRQMVDVITSANNEYFFHGREVFEQHHAFFKEIVSREPYSLYASESTLPGWDDLIVRFRKASEAIVSTN